MALTLPGAVVQIHSEVVEEVRHFGVGRMIPPIGTKRQTRIDDGIPRSSSVD